MNRLLLYQNAQQKLFETCNKVEEVIPKIEEYYQKQGTTLDEALKNYSIRVYYVDILKNTDKEKEAKIISMSPNGKLLEEPKGIIWTLKGSYKNIRISITALDKKDITYHIWETLEFLLGKESKNIIEDFSFEIKVKTKNNQS